MGGEEREVEGRDSIGIRGKEREWKQSNMQEGKRGGQRFGSDGGKWKNQRELLPPDMQYSREKKGCFVQRVALVQDECQGFWAGSVINTCNGPNDDKLCLRGKNLEETLRPLSFWNN